MTATATEWIDATGSAGAIAAAIDSLFVNSGAHGSAVRSITMGNKIRFYIVG